MPRTDSEAPAERGLGAAIRNTRLSVRLAVLSAALAALVLGLTFAALSVQVRASSRGLLSEQLTRNGRTLVTLQRENRRQLVMTAALLAESPSLRSAMSTYRVEQENTSASRTDLTATVGRELEAIGSDLGAGVLLATDERGRVVAGYARHGAAQLRDADLSALPAVRNALDPSVQTTQDEAYLAGLEIGDAYYGVGVAPVILDGYTIGTIVFGQPVDSALVDAMRKAFDGDVVVAAGDKVVGATIPRTLAARAAHDPGQTGGELTLGDEEYLVAAIPLGRTQRGTPLRITLLQPLTPSVRTLTGALRKDFLLYGTLAVLFAALGAAWMARSVLGPLARFIAYLRDGASRERLDGTFDAANASPEIRLLDQTFTQVISSLDARRGELEARSRELSSANAVLTDEIRDRERVERALHESEAQFRQSQKLEAVGTLAGGIAHDFNNMLTVISGFTQLALRALPKDHEVVDDLRQVSDAATSAAGLTHQLLAFSRKQVLQPRVLELEQVVRGMESMLRRLIGAHITLEASHVGDPARVRADPGQLEQVILNLAVNARDAMPDGGILRISTDHRSGPEGRQVTLTVHDTGSGIPPEVRDRIFEPFFTTKEVGKGTGLGLSTVYGIVAQSGGTLEVDSIMGRGTTFTIVLPAVLEAMPEDPAVMAGTEPPRGTETVLVVDDQAAVLALASRSLEDCGYTVLRARSAVEALTMARETRVHVLLTDIVMPQMTGPQLVERYLARFPAPVVIYMTGHVDDSIVRLELDADVHLIRKPFTPLDLARVVRSSLDLHRSVQPVAHDVQL